MNNSSLIIQASGVTKLFSDGKREVKVLNGVDFSVSSGEMVAILGASGSGKSTLLQIIGGLEPPTDGQVVVDGQPIHQLKEVQRCQIRNQSLGFVYQFHHLLPEFTAEENVAMPLRIRGIAPKQALAVARKYLQEVGLGERVLHKPAELSGGERQRTAIARALAGEPRVVLADEPTGNLDSQTASDVLSLLKRLNKSLGTAFVIVTHDLSLAKQLDRMETMVDGELTSI